MAQKIIVRSKTTRMWPDHDIRIEEGQTHTFDELPDVVVAAMQRLADVGLLTLELGEPPADEAAAKAKARADAEAKRAAEEAAQKAADEAAAKAKSDADAKAASKSSSKG